MYELRTGATEASLGSTHLYLKCPLDPELLSLVDGRDLPIDSSCHEQRIIAPSILSGRAPSGWLLVLTGYAQTQVPGTRIAFALTLASPF